MQRMWAAPDMALFPTHNAMKAYIRGEHPQLPGLLVYKDSRLQLQIKVLSGDPPAHAPTSIGLARVTNLFIGSQQIYQVTHAQLALTFYVQHKGAVRAYVPSASALVSIKCSV